MRSEVYVPEFFVVHLGRPSQAAENIYVSFPDYIKNVASSEIFPTWPENALRANIYAQISFALNRFYTEWYPSRGYDFDITNSTQFDQAFVPGRDIFDNISRIVDSIFNDYLKRYNAVEPLFAQFCNGTTVTCDGLSQWGTVDLANRGYTPYEILTYYYGDDLQIVQEAPVRIPAASYPGYPLRIGSAGNEVRLIQVYLNRVSQNYPRIPRIEMVDGIFGQFTDDAVREFQRIFNLAVDGIVGKETWYALTYMYTSVKKLSELASEGVRLEEVSKQFPTSLQLGSSGYGVQVLQYYLAVIAMYNPTITPVEITGYFGETTDSAVRAFQTEQGLTVDGVVGNEMWARLFEVYVGIVRSTNLSEQRNEVALFPGIVLKQGMRGEDVRILQTYLAEISRSFPSIPIVSVDGMFGPVTYNAVRAFQQQFGLPVDGLVTAITWDRIAGVYYDLTHSGTVVGQFPGYVLQQLASSGQTGG